MEHGRELTIVVVTIAALAAGAGTRVVARRTGIPYTIALLLVGLLVGLLLDSPGTDNPTSGVIQFAADITPDLIIFVFLPALIFESAFALDAYGFRKNLGPIAVLAVPGLLASTVGAAFAMHWLTADGWALSLPAALVFGALISATDPVAVVAILRELGAPRRLSILIEGESLLNDGTAIVVFNLVMGLLVAGSGQIDVGAAAVDFARVVAGGVAVGAAVGLLGSSWLSRTFNDPLVEITLTLVMAYAAMAIAEGMLHVSGVMALVTAGLWMSSVGRPRISPEVQHFLHQFWQLLAYIANTLIFILVGLLVASQVEHASWADMLLIVAAYVVLTGIRLAVTFALLPVMNRLGEPITAAQAAVMSWSGLRGAVSLALALIACQHPGLPEELRRQLLLLTAGVAFLTIVVNGSTVSRLLARFGFDAPLAGEALALAGTRVRALAEVGERVDALSSVLRSVDWSEVERSLREKRDAAEVRVTEIRARLDRANGSERAAGFHQQVLSVERQLYWGLYGQGIIGARALRVLTRELDVQLGRVARGDTRLPESRLRAGADWIGKLSGWLRGFGIDAGSIPFEHLTLVYDLAWATHQASVGVLSFVTTLDDAHPEVRLQLVEAYRGYRREGRERLEDLRTNLPEMTRAVEARLARRIELNLERAEYERLAREGVLDAQEAERSKAEVEAEMKRLLLSPTQVALPETAELCRRAPLFSVLDEEALQQLAVLTRERVFSPGDVLFRQGERGESMFVIARGAVHVIREGGAGGGGGGGGQGGGVGGPGAGEELMVLGGGDILGEMALLSGEPRTATARAATTVTVGEVRREHFEQLMRSQPELREGVWRAFVRRLLDNYLRDHPELPDLGPLELEAWTAEAPIVHLDAWQSPDSHAAQFAFVVLGHCVIGGQAHAAPAFCRLSGNGERLEARSRAVLLMLGPLPLVQRQSVP